MKLVALSKFKYGTRQLIPGDTFDASKQDAKLLEVLKRAHAPPDVEAKTIKSVSEQQPDNVAEKPRRGRPPKNDPRYKRRDMRAED